MCSGLVDMARRHYRCSFLYLGAAVLAAGLPERVQVKEGGSRVSSIIQLPAFPVLISVAQALECALASVCSANGCLQLCLLYHFAVLDKLL
jgi:hypothetical protein